MSRAEYWAVLPAAGVGRRMGAGRPKQYLTLGRRTVIEHALEALLQVPRVEGAVVALAADDPYWDALGYRPAKPLLRAPGGPERAHSVLNALGVLRVRSGADCRVLVHDAARPCLRPADVDALIDAVGDDPHGGLLGLHVRDTMKRADQSGRVTATVDRRALWHALTPQLFPLPALETALASALAAGGEVTDDASAMERAGHRPLLVEGWPDNLKITRPSDLPLAEQSLREQGRL